MSRRPSERALGCRRRPRRTGRVPVSVPEYVNVGGRYERSARVLTAHFNTDSEVAVVGRDFEDGASRTDGPLCGLVRSTAHGA